MKYIHPPPPVATDEQPIAKNTQFYTNFHNFFSLHLFCRFFDILR